MSLQMEQGLSPSTSFASRTKITSLPSAEAFTQGLTGINQTKNFAFVNALVAFSLSVLAISLVVRASLRGIAHARHLHSIASSRARQEYWMYNRTSWWPWVQRNLLYTSLRRNRHNQMLKARGAMSLGSLPSRSSSLIILVYLVINLAFNLALDYRQSRPALFAELRGRSGALAVYNIIPAVLFSMRCNPFSTLLKINFDTFNLYHRWCARTAVLEATLHVLAFALNKYETDGGGMRAINQVMGRPFNRVGLAGAIVLWLMLIVSVRPFRRAHWELFATTHRLAAYCALIVIYLHLDWGNYPHRLPQLPWIKFAVAILALEYLCRATILFWLNFSKVNGLTQARIEALPGQACRVTIISARPWRFKSGSFVHLYLPRYSLWSSHPFSVAWSGHEVSVSRREPVSSADDSSAEKNPGHSATDLEAYCGGSVQTHLSLIIRARAGFTRKLYDMANSAPNKTLNTFGMIEGPYGGHESLDSFGTTVLFAGGVGITHQLSRIRHVVAAASAEPPLVATRRAVLVWSMPTNECLEWIRPWMNEVLMIPSRREIFQCILYISRSTSTQHPFLSPNGSVQLFPGRCDIQSILDKILVDRIGHVFVSTCGPGSLNDAVRNAVRNRVDRHTAITFSEESYSY